MALDTRDRRFSMLGLAMPFRVVLPNPAVGFDQGDRQQFEYSYRGILFGTTAPPPPIFIRYAVTHAYRQRYTATVSF